MMLFDVFLDGFAVFRAIPQAKGAVPSLSLACM